MASSPEESAVASDTLAREIARRRTFAIISHPDAGKTTLTSLVARIADVEQGAVRIDGHDVREITQDSLHDAIGIVPQDTVLFNDTLAYNIAYGRPDASDADMLAAAQRAEADEFIQTLSDPKGRTAYDAHVGERGVKLSGGQRQRLAIARALLKNAPIFLMAVNEI